MSFPPPDQLTHAEHYNDPSEYPYPGVPVDKGTCRLLGPTALVRIQNRVNDHHAPRSTPFSLAGRSRTHGCSRHRFPRFQAAARKADAAVAYMVRIKDTSDAEPGFSPLACRLFDVSKQVLGQGFVHGLNLLISDIVAHVAQGNPCDLYFLNVFIDTTLGTLFSLLLILLHMMDELKSSLRIFNSFPGVAFIYLILHGANKLFTDRLHLKGFQSGQYGDPPSIVYWARQAAVYVSTILTMKLLVVGLFAVWPGIFDVGEWLLSWTGESDGLQIIL